MNNFCPFPARSLFALDLWQVLSATYNAFGTGFTTFILVGERGGPEWRVAADLACYGVEKNNCSAKKIITFLLPPSSWHLPYFMAVGFLFKYEFTSTSVPPPPPPPSQPQEPTPNTPLLTPPNPQLQRGLPPTPPPSLQTVAPLAPAPLAPAPEENLSGQEDPLLPIDVGTGDAGEGGGNLNQSGQHVYESVCHIQKYGFSCVYFGDHITTDYNMYYATYCIFFSLFLTRAR